MKASLSFPARTLQGTVPNSNLVFFARGLCTFARSKVMPASPNSPNQVIARAIFSAITKAWRTTTAAAREAWKTCADT